MKKIVYQLELSRFRDSIRNNYYQIWKAFNKFVIKLDIKPDTWEERIILYVGYLISRKRQSRTIRSYISAIKAVLKENRIKLLENAYLLSSLTKACKLKNDRVKIRLPIQKDLLRVLLKGVKKKFCGTSDNQQPYLDILYRAIFITAYYGLFRVGELALGPHTILAKDVHIGQNKDKILFVLHSSKTHGKGDKPQMVKIEATG